MKLKNQKKEFYEKKAMELDFLTWGRTDSEVT